MKTTILIPMILMCACLSAQKYKTTEIPLNDIIEVRKGPTPVSGIFTAVIPQHTECIPEITRNEVKEQIALNRAMILQKDPQLLDKSRGSHPMFVSPVRAKTGFDDYGYHTVNFQVDHNSTPNNNLQDYHCGQRTYDWATGNHTGTDYILWPYPWKRMQEEIMEIVAAAPGVIIDKRDGNYDLNCANDGNPNWNGIVLEHNDGSQTWYWHFKDGAITSKNIGDAVAEGEYLGAAGSSGSSNWPHLHFEVYDFQGNLVDPYNGSCNNMNASSWWQTQEDYNVPVINRISTHNSTQFDQSCPNVENTYEELNFNAGDQLVIRLFYRDIQHMVNTDIKITDPNGDLLYDWTWQQNWGEDYASAHASWPIDVTSAWPQGIYSLEANFGGNNYQTVFGVGTSLGVEPQNIAAFTIYPNPVAGKLFIESPKQMDKIMLFDVRGRMVLENNEKQLTTNMIDIESLKSGVYFIQILSEGKLSTHKIIKK